MRKLAHFSGPWREADRAALLAAVEPLGEGDAPGVAEVWSFRLHASDTAPLLTAARAGWTRVLTARSVEDLVDRIGALTPAALAA